MARPEETFFKEGCFIEEWLNTADQQDLSVARVRVAGLNQTRLHCLRSTTERYVILRGQGRVTVGQTSWLVSEGDVVTIEADQPQKIANLESDDLIFLAICNPRFQIDCYQDLESDT